MAQNLMAATSSLPSVLVSQQLIATEATFYTCPASSAVKLAAATITNMTGASVTVSVSIVKAGGTAGATNRVATFTLTAGDSTVLSEVAGHFLGPGDFISAIAGSANAASFVLSGVVFS